MRPGWMWSGICSNFTASLLDKLLMDIVIHQLSWPNPHGIVGYHLYAQLLQTRVPVEELNHLINVILYEWVCHPFLPRRNLSLPRGKNPWSAINLLGFASAIPIHDPLTQYCGKPAKWEVFGYGVASQTPKQGRIYGRKHCPTPANLQHISGTPPAILDFLLLYPPFRWEDHLIIWFMIGESTKKPKKTLHKKLSHLHNSAPSWDWDYIPRDGSLRLLRIFPPRYMASLPRLLHTNIKMGDTSTAFPRYRSNTGWYICCDVYNAPKTSNNSTHACTNTNTCSFIYIPPFLVLKTLVILQYFVVKESPPPSGQQDLRIRQFPCTRSKQDSVTVPAMGK